MSIYTESQLTALKAAYSSGVLEVWEGNTRIKYQSMSDMRQAISDMENEIALQSSQSFNTKVVTVRKSR